MITMKQINASVAEEREAFFQLLDERTGETNQRVTETVQEFLKTVKSGGDDPVLRRGPVERLLQRPDLHHQERLPAPADGAALHPAQQPDRHAEGGYLRHGRRRHQERRPAGLYGRGHEIRADRRFLRAFADCLSLRAEVLCDRHDGRRGEGLIPK